jgi:hypothetical protein
MNDINTVQMFIGIWSLVKGLEEMSEATVDLENELRAYKSLKLTEKQKENLAEELKKTPADYMKELMEKAEKEEKKSK